MRVFFDSIGCRLNQSEIEAAARRFVQHGHQIASSSAAADIVVINTCGVTSQAAADSRSRIRAHARQAPEGCRIIVTGCWSELEPDAALALPGVSLLVSNREKDHLTEAVLGLGEMDFPENPDVRVLLPGERHRTRAFIKVQDGCDHGCTYCVTRIARGKARSLPYAVIAASVRAALRGGSREIVLTGVQLGFWGKDMAPRRNLAGLVRQVMDELAPERLRLSSLEPWDVDADLIGLLADPRFCPHLHLPLQSGSDTVLRRMARPFRSGEFRDLCNRIRALAPDIALTTDLIAGFPGETDAEFEETLTFVRDMAFADGHVFPYSARQGTPAARFAAQVAPELRKERAQRLREELALSGANYTFRQLGATLQVLWERAQRLPEGGWQLEGLSGNYQRVRLVSSQDLRNTLSEVRITSLAEGQLGGKIVKEGAKTPSV